MAAPTYPLVNGIKYDWSCVEITLVDEVFTGVKEISYSSKTEPGEVFGTSAQKFGRTRGQNKPEASVTLYKLDYHQLIAKMGQGFHEYVFGITVNYDDGSGNVVTDKIIGCRIKGAENSHTDGTDALVMKVDLDVMAIVENGLLPVKNMKGIS